MPNGSDTHLTWAQIMEHLGRNSERLATLETKVDQIISSHKSCSQRQTTNIERVARDMAGIQEQLRKHCQEDKVRQASWSRWEKLGLGFLTTFVAPIVLLIIGYILAHAGVPVADGAAAAVETLSR